MLSLQSPWPRFAREQAGPLGRAAGKQSRPSGTMDAVAGGKARPMHERIDIDPKIMQGKPVIHGTRVPVELILRKLGAGMTAEEIIADHPRLAAEDIRAAQAFAADYLADEEIVYG